ncbi:uncharacterized protein A1O9_11711 [Exophiala aquamarina CBS 119918]|uniref:DUF788 domain-containing protein n=1 Tax=Exophiala aquamarina CBS 119918 TaxID=1182545 RepID=A0A072P915_9EURO|nr:uncharacterized protein A1O9_11711 [Exophiala aquamarina CBS 119918]KEF52085.1 hypothetical protein A1O9_11711 [Exophiala aquamarina CBS 119918]
MAQKAAKTLAVRNTSRLKQTHLITLAIHGIFLLLRFTLRTSLSLKRYSFLSAPALLIEFYLEKLARPSYNPDGSLRRAGEDLDAQGLTEFMWDILYWTWINLVLVAILGNRAWWLYLAIPAYAVYAAVTTASGLKSSFAGLAGGGAEPASQSKRQQKMEKRGGQRVAYR